MNEELFLRKLKTTYPDFNAKDCYVQIPIMKEEYESFEIIPCDEKGHFIEASEDIRIINKYDIKDRKISFQRSKFSNKYYKIVAVLQDGTRLQTTELNNENMVIVEVLPIIVKYSLLNDTKSSIWFCKSKRSKEGTVLNIRCNENIKSGEIGYIKNNLFIPLPDIKRQSSIVLPFKDESLTLIKADPQKNYKLERE